MEIGDVITWIRTNTPIRISTPTDIGIIVGKHWSYKGTFWWVCFQTGQYSSKTRILCNQKHITKLEEW